MLGGHAVGNRDRACPLYCLCVIGLCLADQVLSTPILARLWWLEGKPDNLEKLVSKGRDEMFEKVAELFTTSAERPVADPIAELIRLFLQGLDPRFRDARRATVGGRPPGALCVSPGRSLTCSRWPTGGAMGNNIQTTT